LEPIEIIEFNGAIHYDTIGELIHQFKNRVHILGVHTGTYKKLLLVMIESLENIMKYSEYPTNHEQEVSAFIPVFSIIRDKNHYMITASNMVENKNIEPLGDRINYLNNLSQQELKDFYKAIITNGKFSTRGGAGLGLIEIAKISGNKIQHEFIPVTDNYSMFIMKVRVEESIL
jgi:hypothetical protein